MLARRNGWRGEQKIDAGQENLLRTEKTGVYGRPEIPFTSRRERVKVLRSRLSPNEDGMSEIKSRRVGWVGK